MPIYLCQPGTSTNEPWRHGVQVYERPFPMSNDDTDNQNNNSNNNAPSSTNTGTQTTPPNTTPSSNNTTTNTNNNTNNTTNNTTTSGPEQIVVMIKLPPSQLIHAPNEVSAQSIAIDNEKIIALKRYLTEFISSPTDRVLIFCNNNGKPFPGYRAIQGINSNCKADVIEAKIKENGRREEEQQESMPVGGLGVVMDKDDYLSESRLDMFLNSEGGSTLSTLIVYDGAGKFYYLMFSCFI